LENVSREIPNTKSYTYYLDAALDKFVILDVEPKCPDDIKAKLLELPAIYTETSMSGKGLHLVFPYPETIANKYPIIATKPAMKEEHGWYEILLQHYVTFTANQITNKPTNKNASFEKIFEKLAAKQKVSHREDIEIEELKEVKTEKTPKILETLMYTSKNYYKKTLEDFAGDNSRFEFSYLGWLNVRLQNILNLAEIKIEHEYSNSERAWFLYQTAKDFLPYRAKHDELRDGLPWLLFEAREVIAKEKRK
jgi:ribosomal protein L20A (L18A)